MSLTDKQVDNIMEDIPEEWKHRWCKATICACLGGVNCSGGARAKGMTYEDYLAWCARNPAYIWKGPKHSRHVDVYQTKKMNEMWKELREDD